MRELSVAEQRYQAVMAVIGDGLTVSQAAEKAGVARQTLHRAGMVDPADRDRRSRKWKRWERGAPMELWQMDVVGGFPLADGSCAKALTGIDDHSRMCVCARLMVRERTRAVCDGLRAALASYGVPEQILTDNGKVFTGRFHHPPVEVLFDAICREYGVDHLLTQPRSPTTTGKIERFHRSLRAEFLSNRKPFGNLKVAQQALNEWVDYYNTARPHQALDMVAPVERFSPGAAVTMPAGPATVCQDRSGDDWVSRRVTTNGVVSVAWQQVCVGAHYAGARCDVHVDGDLLRFFIGDDLVKTAARTGRGAVRNKRAFRSREQA
jgi:transposase InsO family protein